MKHIIAQLLMTTLFFNNLNAQDQFVNNGTLQLNSGVIIAFQGDFMNNGTFDAGTSTVVLNGSSAQTIGGIAAINFYNLSIDNSSAIVSNNVTANLFNTLALSSNSQFDADGTGAGVFTLKSTDIVDSRIDIIPSGATITGNLTFEKYFAGQGIKYWRHISSPVVGATVEDLQAEIPISGTFTGNDNGDPGIPINAYPSLYYYNPAATGATLDDRWAVYPTSTNTELLTTTGTEARGYAIWVRETGAITHNLTGTVNQGTVNFNIDSSNEGWNLIGNPFPSDIDWGAASGWTKTGIQGNAIYVWDGTNYNVSNGTPLFDGLIAKGQGFWVQTDPNESNPKLEATEEVKTTSAATTYRTMETSEPSYIDLSVSASGYTDHAYIQFIDSAKFEFDIADATKLSNDIFNLATLSSDSIKLCINVIGGDSCQFDIPIQLWNTWDGLYTFSWKVTPDLLSKYSISLEDKATNSVYDIISNDVDFNFDISKVPETKDINRFVLHFGYLSPNTDIQIETVQSCQTSESASINLNTSQIGVDYVLLKDKNEIAMLSGTGASLTFELDSALLSTGTNAFTVRVISTICNSESHDLMVEFESIEAAELGIPISVLVCYNSSAELMVWESLGAASYRWYQEEADKEPILETERPRYETPNLTESTSYYVSAVNASGCESERKQINADVIPELYILNDIISKDSICFNEDLSISIDSSISKMKYFITLGKEVVSDTLEGSGGNTDLVIVSNNIPIGISTFTVNVLNETCNEYQQLAKSVEVYKSLSSVSSIESVIAEDLCDVGSSLITASGANSGEQYAWYNNLDDNAAFVIESIGEFQTPLLGQSQIYYVAVINETGCESTRTPIEVTVNRLTEPIVTVDTLGDNSYELSSNYLKGNQWYYNDTLMVAEINQTLTTEVPGFYRVEVTAESCSAMSDTIELMNILLGFENFGVNLGIEIYPNPAYDYVTVSFEKSRGAIKLSIININGSVVLTKDYAGTSIIELNVSELQQGAYVINVATESANYISRLIIE